MALNEGLPQLKQILCDIGMGTADREYVATRWASEVEALRQRPGAQAASEPVAWKVKSSNGKSVFFEDRPNWHIENGYEVQPLYPTPARERPGAQATSAAAVMALVDDLCGAHTDAIREFIRNKNSPEYRRLKDIVDGKRESVRRALVAPSTGGAETAPAAELEACSCPCCREGIEAPHEYHLERRRHG